jgi:hypothetical protein
MAGAESEEAGQMQRRAGVLFVAAVVLVSVGCTAILIWQTEIGNISMRTVRYGLGALMIVVGVGFTVMQKCVGDKYLVRHFGAQDVSQTRKMWRGGWVGALIGAAIIAAAYLFG